MSALYLCSRFHRLVVHLHGQHASHRDRVAQCGFNATLTTIRGFLRQLDPASVEAAFRRHAAVLNDARNGEGQRHVAIDGKTLRRSFNNFLDRRAADILSAFASDKALVLGHLD
jgi:hypothetical protein